MAPELTPEELAAALDGCASELLWEAGIDGPPIDGFHVAERLGLVVAEDPTLTARARFARLAEGGQGAVDPGLIVLAAEDRPERRHWAVAHEVGEFAAQRVFDRLGLRPEEAAPSTREVIANGLAGRLLLPRRWVEADARGADWDLLALKNVYCTASHELIARRMLELIRSPVIVTLFDHGDVTWRRTNFGRTACALAEQERAAWRACHDACVPTLADSAPYLVRARCWPVHEPGWRREILLTELAEFE